MSTVFDDRDTALTKNSGGMRDTNKHITHA